MLARVLLLILLLGAPPAWAGIHARDEGTALNFIVNVDCVGAGISCATSSTNTLTMTVAGGGGGSGDVTDVGPGCATGACLTDGLATTGTEIAVWEGTTVNLNELRLIVPLDPAADIDLTLPTATATLATLALTETLTNKTLTAAANTVTINAADLVDQNAGTDITADLEEETHGTEHDGTDGDFVTDSGDTMTGTLTLDTAAGTNAALTEIGIDRASGVAETFNVQNSGVGAMTLQVDGTAVVLESRTLTAGAGLTGGGTLAADRTFDVGAGSAITVAADTIAVTTNGITATHIDETANYVFTGTLVNVGTAPSVTTDGQVGHDTTDDQWLYGAGPNVLYPRFRKCIRVDNLDDTDNQFIFQTPVAITVQTVGCRTASFTTQPTLTFEDGSDNAMTGAPTCNATETQADTAITAAGAVAANESIRFNVTNTPAPLFGTSAILCLSGTYDRT